MMAPAPGVRSYLWRHPKVSELQSPPLGSREEAKRAKSETAEVIYRRPFAVEGSRPWIRGCSPRLPRAAQSITKPSDRKLEIIIMAKGNNSQKKEVKKKKKEKPKALPPSRRGA